MKVVALIGNGCSIPYNPDLAMEPLTTLVLGRFAQSESTVVEVQEVLARLAESANKDFSARAAVFEELFGPIERLDRGLTALARLTQLLEAGTDVYEALLTAVRFGEELRKRTLGAALHVIADLSTGQGNDAKVPVRRLVEWLVTNAGSRGITRIFTLNYDALVDGAAIEVRDQSRRRIPTPWTRRVVVGDMAQGFGESSFEVVPGSTATGFPLRDDDEYGSANLIIYHLHGSLQWLRHENGSIWKVDQLVRLRELDFWTLYSRGETTLEPVVILADQKVRAVELDPFRWAYDRFEDALRDADAVMIAGYGFGDVPVNRALARGLARTDCPIVCIDHTDQPTALGASMPSKIAGNDPAASQLAARLGKRFSKTLRVYGQGIPAALDDVSWR